MTVSNCVFVCLYDLSVYFIVPVSFGDWYLESRPELKSLVKVRFLLPNFFLPILLYYLIITPLSDEVLA